MVKKKNQSDGLIDNSSTDSSEEKMFQSPIVASSSNCQHIKKSVDPTKLRKLLKTNGLSIDCAQCNKLGAVSPANEVSEESANNSFEYDNTLWLCLKCGTQLCGRTKNQHALEHFKVPRSESHALTMNTRSFEIWCYDCDSEVSANSRKNLLECVEIVKKTAQQPSEAPTTINNVENKIISTWETLRPIVGADDSLQSNNSNKIIMLPPPPPPSIPGMAKRVNNDTTCSSNFNFPITSIPLICSGAPLGNHYHDLSLNENLPRVRGLTNLGNTCFFNAVMQCLAQTPYLLEVLKESSEPGEEFILPGGTFQFKDDEIELPMIKGTLTSWGGLTASLAQALEELQSGGGVFSPSKLFDKLCVKCPQFRGGDQHDSHELLRHLLESVRSEDLKRYQRVILQNLGYNFQDISSVSEEMRQKCKIYGNQAADRILRPEQVFRGFLVSTLTCQDCYNVSSRHEYFLDMSLPVSVEKPQPPQRRKSSPDNSPVNSFYINPNPTGPSKSQLKKEKEKERKAKRAAKHHNNKLSQKLMLDDVTCTPNEENEASSTGEVFGLFITSSSSSEQSDADVEDNLIDDNNSKEKIRSTPSSSVGYCDPNGNNEIRGPTEKNLKNSEQSAGNIDKDSLDEDENDSGIANSPANGGDKFPTTNSVNGGGDSANPVSTATNSILSVGLSEKGANFVRQLSLDNTNPPGVNVPVTAPNLTNGEVKDESSLLTNLDQLQLNEQKTARIKARRVRTQSYSDWSTTIAPRYQCEDGECSVQSCLNNFTAVELMTSNNKVGCDNCTKNINGDDPNAKTIYTNATKQFLISSPPAVLILHLKRFQLGPRCMFRKLTRGVTFQMVLDIAPFCGSKVKNLPNIDRKQKKLLYALYGVVEHSGGMYGGHYIAYVKVRPRLALNDPRWKFIPQGSKAELDQDDEQRKKLEELLAKEKARELRMRAAEDSDDFSNSGNSSTDSSSESEETSRRNPDTETGAVGGVDEEARNVQVPMGKWYYVSDSRVHEVTEEAVLKAQAYLLFYERIY